MKVSDSHRPNSYWGLFKNLHQSVRQNFHTGSNTMKTAFGAWKSDQSAEQIIQQLRNSRDTKRHIEEL